MGDLEGRLGFAIVTVSNSTLKEGVPSPAPSGWIFKCHGFWHNSALVVPSVIFVLFLVFQARKNVRAFSHGRSYIMITYYLSVWIVSILNLAWCSLQVWECDPGRVMGWNILSLFTTSGMLFLEVSLIAFLLQGNVASGLDALRFTFIISGLIIGSDMLLKAIYLFGFDVPLFIHNDENPEKVKWGLWIAHRLVLTTVYGIILFMYHSKWKDRLPARVSFYHYILIMSSLNACGLFGCVLAANGAGIGFWLYDTTIICYHALYLPFLYVTFLADFFEEECSQLEPSYYSEMKDAGFFDDDFL